MKTSQHGVNLARYFVLCTADAGNVIPEDGSESNNARFTTTTIVLAAPPSNYSAPWVTQGTDVAVQLVPNSVLIGNSRVVVSYSVWNNGTTATQATRWYDALVLSLDDEYSPSVDFLLFPSREHVGALAPGGHYDVDSFTAQIPRDLAGQLAFVFLVADVGTAVADGNRSNNAVRSYAHLHKEYYLYQPLNEGVTANPRAPLPLHTHTHTHTRSHTCI